MYGGGEDKDKELLRSSDCLFARKFDMDRYPDIVNYIKDMLSIGV